MAETEGASCSAPCSPLILPVSRQKAPVRIARIVAEAALKSPCGRRMAPAFRREIARNPAAPVASASTADAPNSGEPPSPPCRKPDQAEQSSERQDPCPGFGYRRGGEGGDEWNLQVSRRIASRPEPVCRLKGYGRPSRRCGCSPQARTAGIRSPRDEGSYVKFLFNIDEYYVLAAIMYWPPA